jgi:hypothetical protein
MFGVKRSAAVGYLVTLTKTGRIILGDNAFAGGFFSEQIGIDTLP